MITRAVVRGGRPFPPAGPDQVEVMPGAAEALDRLRAAGYRLIVVTNQPDVARGRQQRATVEAIHARLAAALPIDEFRVCYHDDGDECACRKPRPGLLIDAARDAGVSLVESVIIGDRWRDIDAGHAAGCRTVFIDYGYAERRPDAPDAVVASLVDAADWILTRDLESR